MDYFEKIFEQKQKQVQPPAKLIARPNLVPGLCAVNIYTTTLDTQQGGLDCWVYVTEGMVGSGQKELVFVLKRNPDQAEGDFAQEPMHLFKEFFLLARQGRTIELGDHSSFDENSLFFNGQLVFLPVQPLNGILLPEDALLALVVRTEELEGYREYGMTRFMSRLGNVYQYYPCPPWTDLERNGLSFQGVQEKSFLYKVARLKQLSMYVYQQGPEVILQNSPAAQPWLEKFFQEIPENQPVALLTGLDPQADACLTWEPDQQRPLAISLPNSTGSQICGCFAAFVPDVPEEKQDFRLMEDGFIWLITRDVWKAVRQALVEGKSIHCGTVEGRLFLAIR